MNKQKQLLIKQLDEKMRKMSNCRNMVPPSNGWLRAIRTALGIPRRVIAGKLGISEPSLAGIETREAEGTITLKTLRETAEALDLVLVYGFIPKEESLRGYIRKKAYEAATKIVLRTANTMELENQAITDKRIKAAIMEKTHELESKLPGFLWE